MFANPKIGRSSEKQNINELRQDFLERKIDHNFSNSKISNKTLKLPKINRMSAENIVYDRNNIFRQSQSKYKGQLGDSLRLSSANKNPSPKKSAENKNIILQKKKYESPNIFINRKQNVSEMTKSKLNFNEPKNSFIKKSPSRIGLKSQKEKQLAFEPILDTKGDILNLNPESFSRVNTSNTQKKQKLTVSQSQKIMSGKIYNIAQSDEPTINRYASIKNLSKLKNEDFIKFRNLINNREKVQEKYADYQIDTKLDANNNVVCCSDKMIISCFGLCFRSPKKSTILLVSLKTQILFVPHFYSDGLVSLQQPMGLSNVSTIATTLYYLL